VVSAAELRELLDAAPEWLLVRGSGRAFPLENHLIEINDKQQLSLLDEGGWRTWRLRECKLEGAELVVVANGQFGGEREEMRLIPRLQAAELTAEIELARLEKANEIASLVAAHYKGSKLARVALNNETGRLAQISFETANKVQMVAIADVTGKMTVEAIFTAAILWLDKLSQQKKKPVNDLLIVCERRAAKNAQKLHALLAEFWKGKITIFHIDRRSQPPGLKDLPKRAIRDLWRQRSKPFRLSDQPVISETAARIIELAPNEIDVIYSRQGETLRFHGLPFARIRVMLGKETAWFGIGRERKVLEENFDDLVELIDLLKTNRCPEAPNRRHSLYKAAPEAWLESIFRRNITLLDANLILSPIYNQFRSSNDKIDLLALRRDGRLVVIELKTQPDREMVFQAADYWRKIELQRRRGDLAAANLFEGREILDKPTLVYLAAPAWSFHRDFEFFARSISPDIELWRFELHEDWRREVKVIARHDYR
jgi:hypothetical protein